MSLLDYILPWRHRRRSAPRDLTFVLYTRSGCSLCDNALQLLQAERKRLAFRLDIVDIDSDPKLREMYTDCVPVVAVNGKVYFRGRVNPVLLRRLLKGLSA